MALRTQYTSVSVLNEERKNFKEENERLIERIEILESGGEIGAQGFRVKDLRKQVDKLQDELFKVESSRDEYRSRVENLEKENTEVISKNEELQKLADEARSLKDEVDALRDMSDRVALLEGSCETYKKRLEELSLLRKQVKILEEKNTEYMHQIMELEEEVKKSGTWRPQLDLYKKQVSDLHQKLNDESKKTDRQIFENKKLIEKLEAVTQEKERVLHERDMLKETNEDLKLTFTQAINTSSPGSKLLSDSDLDVLGLPPEIREKLRRLQHENTLLKKKASDSATESDPILQSLLNDLQERHDKLLQENRWEKFSPPSPRSLFYSPRWPSLGKMGSNFDPFLLKSNSKKVNLLKRNLKWASESDLLILRQPPHTNLMNLWSLNAVNSKRKFSTPSDKSLTLPTPTTHNGKDNPIVIHHIHEFKMAPSPTNEDSGCCRTSPSSCEGCEDHRLSGSYGIRTPDFGNTLDSANQEKSLSPTVLHHSHPSHNTTNISSHPPPHLFCSSHNKPGSEVTETKHLKPNNLVIPVTSSNHVTNSSSVINHSPNSQTVEPNIIISESSRPNLTISIPINNRQNSLPSKPEPPDSPTPHNSPRLPHSIHNNRLKGSKLPVSVVSASYSSGLQDIPILSNNKIENLNSVSCEEIKVRNKRFLPEKVSPPPSNLGNSTRSSKPKPFLETDLDSDIILPNRYRSDMRETNIDRIANKLKSGINKVRSKSLEKYKVNNSESTTPKTKVSDNVFIQDEEPVSSISENKPIIPVENLRPLGRSSCTSLKENLNSNKENNRSLGALKIPHFIECTCSPKDRLPNSSSCHTLQSPTSSSPRRESNKKPEVTLITDTLFTHFVVSPKKNSSESGKGKSESSPCISNVQSHSTSVNNYNDQRAKSEKEISTFSDTDTDLELVENRLVSSGYGAPLVSSESNTSILYLENYNKNTHYTDIDPSASEYCTETETEFDPRQFKLSTLTAAYPRKPGRRQSKRQSDRGETKPLADKNVSDTDALIGISTLPVVCIGSTPKKKKKVVLTSKNKILNGGVIKVKNKTTKAVFAETFNAMFTFCTP
ncbi:Protein Hook-like protein 3 [Armadillidium nasatum]|uniref:Protein Hook-like protein 3 n=1 Tax=Armadillidium nasatum TaxID=96803 RepID=A0A5N5TPT5_9CRUS|nr:Protein Hook-like protein 3 [Armadillidium nasatum]